MPDVISTILQQGGLGILAAVAVMWGMSESKAREKERSDAQRSAITERDGYIRMVERERSENQKLQAEVMRLATETAQTNALNRQTLADLKSSLESSKRRYGAAK